MPRDVDLLLEDVLDAATDAIRYADDHTSETFARLAEQDADRFRALKNAIMELGEAVKLLPAEMKSRNASVDWQGMAGLRDIVAHQYFRLDLVRLWPVVTEELPELVRVVEVELMTFREAPPRP